MPRRKHSKGKEAMPKTPYRTTTPRMTLIYTLTAQCFVDPLLAMPWEAMGEAEQHEFEQNGPIPCEGGFVPGEWCGDCRFGLVEMSEGEEGA